jgi:hypothetical protein
LTKWIGPCVAIAPRGLVTCALICRNNAVCASKPIDTTEMPSRYDGGQGGCDAEDRPGKAEPAKKPLYSRFAG